MPPHSDLIFISVVMGFIVLEAEEQKYRAGREGTLVLQSPHTSTEDSDLTVMYHISLSVYTLPTGEFSHE